MLEPAIAHKDELLSLFTKEIYTEDYFFYVGYPYYFGLPELGDPNAGEQWTNNVRWAIMDKGRCIGYFAYKIDTTVDSATQFGLFSFDRGNPVIGFDVFRKMDELVKRHHRIEWRVVEGNPVVRHYDRYCARHNGQKTVLHDVTKDLNGNYLDEYIYEIWRGRA